MIRARAERGWRKVPDPDWAGMIRARAESKLRRAYFVANATRDCSVPLPSRQFIVSRLSAQAP